MILSVCENINKLNEFLFGGIDGAIGSLSLPDWVADALVDSIHTLPFLILVFVIIELIEYYWADKINAIMTGSKHTGPLIGSVASIFPQCGFSIIASSLYSNRFITRGTLLAIYLATSDEALPVLLSYPEKMYLVMPVILTKLVIAIVAGYSIDFLVKTKLRKPKMKEIEHIEEEEEGCCKHDIVTKNKVNLWLHPLTHTFNIFFFILIITLILNFFISETSLTNLFGNSGNRFLEPIITAVIGLIPNCAVSITITMMLIKGTISFGGAIAGLCSNAGFGILVLLRKNKVFKDSIFIILLLMTVSIVSGLILELFT